MLVSQAHSFAQQARLAVALAWIAGFTNTITIIACGTATSHISGTLSQWGLDLAEGRLHALGFATFLILSFLAGAGLAGGLTEWGRARGWKSIYVLPLSVQAVLLAAFAAVLGIGTPKGSPPLLLIYTLACLAALAMGLQNATITRLSGGVVRTTHMTGVMTDLGLEGAQYLWRLRNRGHAAAGAPSAAPTGRRLLLFGSIIASFAIGSGLGALAYHHVPVWAMALPVTFLGWFVVHDLRVPTCEVSMSPAGITGALALPPGIALYHLRKDPRRRGRDHRLPDLLRWAEGLSPDCRAVVLDIEGDSHLDANTALELRSLVQQCGHRGVALILSGMRPEQYRALRSAGAGEALDPSNVCPDLDLAVARALLLAQG